MARAARVHWSFEPTLANSPKKAASTRSTASHPAKDHTSCIMSMCWSNVVIAKFQKHPMSCSRHFWPAILSTCRCTTSYCVSPAGTGRRPWLEAAMAARTALMQRSSLSARPWPWSKLSLAIRANTASR